MSGAKCEALGPATRRLSVTASPHNGGTMDGMKIDRSGSNVYVFPPLVWGVRVHVDVLLHSYSKRSVNIER